ncbi:MAG: type IV secretory system conjugative DNA transfer family protein [Parcubacteria group bacterium]
MEDQEKVTYFAETDSRHNRKKFGIKSKDRSKHIYVIGKTGMGKSTLLENMAVQDIQSGNGLAFIDPHGGTAEKLLEYVPKERIKDVIYFAPFDTDHPISFNVMEDVGANKRHLVVNGLMSVFEKIWEDAWSARMAYILQNTLLALLEYPGATLLAVNRMYTDKEFRNKVVENVTDISVKSFWVDEYAKYTDKYATEATPAIQNKIGQFAGNPLIRNIIGQPKSSFDLRKIMDEKKIMIVNLSKGRVGEGNARLLGSMLITKLYLAAMSRADEKAVSLAKLPQFYLYVDEFQSFADKSFADILSEARKYKLNLTMAHQYIEQMEEEVRDAVFGNVGTMIAFRVGAYDAEVLEKEFAPTFTVEDIVSLGLRQIYLKLMIDSVSSPPFSASTLPPIAVPETSYVDLIVESSRKQFSRPKDEVEKLIVDWHEEGKNVNSSPQTKNKLEPESREPKTIDFRGKKDTEYKEFKNPAPFIPSTAPPPLASLEKLKVQNNNQRKPDAKHVSDLRDALKAVTGGSKAPSGVENSKPKDKSGPSPDELKKIFDGK